MQEGSPELSKEEGTIIKESPPKPAMLVFQQLHNNFEFHYKCWLGGSMVGGSGWQWDLASHWTQ